MKKIKLFALALMSLVAGSSYAKDATAALNVADSIGTGNYYELDCVPDIKKMDFVGYNSTGSGTGSTITVSHWKLSSSRTISFKVVNCGKIEMQNEFTKDATITLSYSINGAAAVAFNTNGSDKKCVKVAEFETGTADTILVTISSTGDVLIGYTRFYPAKDNTPYPYVKSFTMGEIAAAVDTAAKTITAELPYGTNRADAINNAVVKMGGTAKEYEINGDVLIAKDSAEASKNINYDLSGITVSTTQFFTVSYFDGSTLLGSEEVAEGDSPIDFAKYQVKAHCSFVTWMDADSVAVNPGDSAIASDANFYGSWSMEVEQSASLNIEQMVLDNGKSYDIYSEMTSAHIQYANVDALDSLNDAKELRNEPYLGLKIKAEGGYIEMGLKAGDSIKVKFGKVSANLKITINGVDSTLTVADAATPFFYHATEDCWVKIATTTSGTVVLKQIMINDNIQEVTLPETPTALMEIMMNAKAEKFILNGKVYFRHNDQVFNAMGQEMKF